MKVQVERMKKGQQRQECVRCGLYQEQWSNQGSGYKEYDGEAYCCQGCAQQSDCICYDEGESEESVQKVG